MRNSSHNLSSDDELLFFAAESSSSIPTLDLHGKRIFEAESDLDRFLHEQYMANKPYVRIIHGFGTGALQKAVKEVLKNHPLVRIFKTSRDGAATLAVLEDRG